MEHNKGNVQRKNSFTSQNQPATGSSNGPVSRKNSFDKTTNTQSDGIGDRPVTPRSALMSPTKGSPRRRTATDPNHLSPVSPTKTLDSPNFNLTSPGQRKKGLSVLITQCIQEDHMGLIHPGESNPNSLHIGMLEARRLLGEDPMIGPYSRLMKWARAQNPEDLEVLHIRDWHSKSDPHSQEHLDTFGVHCIQNTRGAELVLGLGSAVDKRSNEHYVNSAGLSDFEGTTMMELFDKIKKKAKGGEIRVGVVGVHTEGKVSFLLYDLKTRLNLKNLATCSALTAGKTRAHHFNALEQLEKLMKVNITHSVGEFTDWILKSGKQMCEQDLMEVDPVAVETQKLDLEIEGLEEGPHLIQSDIQLLHLMFRTCSHLHLVPLSGGFSGAHVFKARATDLFGHHLAASVVKLGPLKMIAKEMVNFERVEEVLGNNAPRVKAFVDLHDRAAIRFAYASMSEEKISSFEDVYRSDANQERITSILSFVFEDILGRFYAVSQYERLNLLDCYEFDGKGWAYAKGGSDTPQRVKERITEVLNTDSSQEYLTFPGGVKFRNVAHFLEKDLPSIPKRRMESHYVSYVHGDLNGSNILLDANNNVWLIDFFFTERTHVLKDLTKIENDILFLFTDLQNEQDLIEGIKIIQELVAIEDLGVLLPEETSVTSPALIRAWNSIRILRSVTVPLIRYDRSPMQMSVALLRYALHNLCLDHLTPLQRQLSLAAACAHAEVIKRKIDKEKSPLHVYWFDYPMIKTQGRLGITILPGRADKGRCLEVDLERLQIFETKRLICLCQPIELERGEVTQLPSEAGKYGIMYRGSPIK
eukprot:TRINITY_DN6634_c0_g1_i4.p1 TRINITY_DN6634_c0_g1~~TRINITY_DN6634_c0_g1_i4.p1  ORF type:complete len:814 (-),score=150.15 TRINITY_DN6634_c0_g1_i4:79-2520(-)